jgi:hypothetical protein
MPELLVLYEPGRGLSTENDAGGVDGFLRSK